MSERLLRTPERSRRRAPAALRAPSRAPLLRAALVLLGLLLCSGPGSAAAEPVEIRAAVHPGYARLVLDWPAPVTVERRAGDRWLELRFERPFEAELDVAAATLRRHLDRIERRDGGRSLRLDLGPGVGLARFRQFEPELVVLDFIAPGASEPAVSAGSAEVRTGEHPGFTRLVLDFDAPVVHRVSEDEGRYLLTFDRAVSIDAPRLARELRHVLDELAVVPGVQPKLALRPRPGVRADVYGLDEDKLVVDLRGPAAAAGGSGTVSSAEPPANAVARLDPVGEASELVPPAAPSPPTAPPPGPAPAPDDGEAARGADVATGPADPDPPSPPASRDASPGADASKGSTGGPPGLPAPAAPALASAATGEGADLRIAWPLPVAAAVFARAGVLWLVFEGAPDPAWRTRPPPLDPAVLDVVGPADLLEGADEGFTVLRMPLRRPLAVAATRTGGVWQVRLRPAAEPPRGVRVRRLADPPRVRIEGAGSTRLLKLRDPLVGDELVIWPLAASGTGIAEPHHLVQADLLPAAQGVVVREAADGLRVEPVAGGLEIGASDGLHISMPAAAAGSPSGPGASAALLAGGAPGAEGSGAEPPDPAPGVEATPDAGSGDPDSFAGAGPERRAEPEAAPPQPEELGSGPDGSAAGAGGSMLGLAWWPAAGEVDFADRRARLLRRIDEASGPERDDARLDLARFFLARGMAAEALSLVNDLDPGAAGSRSAMRQALAGAARLLMGRLAAAERDLADPGLEPDPEVALWRAALAAARHDWDAAALELRRSEDTLDVYPPVLKRRLGLPAAMIAAESGELARAFEILEEIGALDLHPNERGELDFIRGLAHARAGESDRAAEIWREVAKRGDDASRIKADYALATTLFNEGRMSAEEALRRLVPARPLWRGHAWEASMLGGLAELQEAAGHPAAAVRTWQEVVRRHPAAARRMGLEDKVRAAFESALRDDHGEPLGPVRALALYRDHPDLLPPGEAGLRFRRQLARRLAGIDLLEPAAELMRAVLEELPPGPEAAEAGVFLAGLALGADDPEAALDALDASEGEGLPRALRSERVRLRAAALERVGRAPEAIALLELAEPEPATGELRNDILWRQQDWPRLAAALERELRSPGSGGAHLTAVQQTAVLKLAIARAQLDDEAGLAGIRRRFARLMRGGPLEAAFLMATSPEGERAGPDAILAAAAGQMRDIQRYLDAP